MGLVSDGLSSNGLSSNGLRSNGLVPIPVVPMGYVLTVISPMGHSINGLNTNMQALSISILINR